jgi:hypothetical protein
MAQFKAFSPDVEVNGAAILSVLEGCPAKTMGIMILASNGIDDPKPGHWYSQQAWLNAFKEISDKIGASTLFSIGQKIPENALFPPGLNSLIGALGSIDVAYHMNHQGGEIGHYKFVKIGEKSAKMVCNNPYPCDFDLGIITAMSKRFKPEKAMFVDVKHDDTCSCRKKGDDSCTYAITW